MADELHGKRIAILAADGVDEMVTVMLGGHPEWASFAGDGRVVRLAATDTGDKWLVEGGLKAGDKVMIPAAVGCGACRPCLAGVVNLCENGMGSCYGLSAKLQGSQAEAVRVPAADVNAVRIPEGVTAEQALLMTDALATAWFGARSADIVPGSSVAVIGLGPIGLMAVESAFVMGAHIVYAIDPIAERRALAEQAE